MSDSNLVIFMTFYILVCLWKLEIATLISLVSYAVCSMEFLISNWVLAVSLQAVKLTFFPLMRISLLSCVFLIWE